MKTMSQENIMKILQRYDKEWLTSTDIKQEIKETLNSIQKNLMRLYSHSEIKRKRNKELKWGYLYKKK